MAKALIVVPTYNERDNAADIAARLLAALPVADLLFVEAPGRPPKIRLYAGRGALDAWVRVVALREALHLREAERGGALPLDESSEVVSRIAPACDPELAFMKESCRGPFVAAFREALAGLGQRERALLRFTFIDGLSPAQAASIYGVHRTTAMRWIEAAEDQVLARTRALLMERLHLSPIECDEIFALVASRLDVTLGSLLETAS